METNNRRDFLKKAALAGASALVAPSLFATGEEGSEISILKNEENGLENNLIVPKNNGLKITGTFLDEISHDRVGISNFRFHGVRARRGPAPRPRQEQSPTASAARSPRCCRRGHAGHSRHLPAPGAGCFCWHGQV